MNAMIIAGLMGAVVMLISAGIAKRINGIESVRFRAAMIDLSQFVFFLIGVAFSVLMLAFAPSANAKPAHYNPEGSPLPTKEMAQAIEYAVEGAWSQRIDVGAEYAGLTGETIIPGEIVFRWSYFPLPEMSALSMGTAGLVAHSADLIGDSVTLANARWWTTDAGELVTAVVTINIAEASKSVDKCMYETLIHEAGHIFMPIAAHAVHPEDVMYPFRGECHYSPSLSDLAMFSKPLNSCHVELTPHGALELLDYNGRRISLGPLHLENSIEPPRFGRWIWSGIYANPVPQHCDGVFVQGSEVWAEVKSFSGDHFVLQLLMQDGRFTAGKKITIN